MWLPFFGSNLSSIFFQNISTRIHFSRLCRKLYSLRFCHAIFRKSEIGHFRVLLCLCFKTSLSAKLFVRKWVLHAVSFSSRATWPLMFWVRSLGTENWFYFIISWSDSFRCCSVVTIGICLLVLSVLLRFVVVFLWNIFCTFLIYVRQGFYYRNGNCNDDVNNDYDKLCCSTYTNFCCEQHAFNVPL